MTIRRCYLDALSLTVGILAFAQTGHAQSPRQWVDPPPEAGTSTASPSPSANAHGPAVRPPASEANTRPVTQTDETSKGPSSQPIQAASPSSTERPLVKGPSRKVATEHRERRQTRSATAAGGERLQQLPQRRVFAKQSDPNTRAARIREGLNSGLEVMTLRTIEFPDGRRIQILTRPKPGSLSELTDPPY